MKFIPRGHVFFTLGKLLGGRLGSLGQLDMSVARDVVLEVLAL